MAEVMSEAARKSVMAMSELVSPLCPPAVWMGVQGERSSSRTEGSFIPGVTPQQRPLDACRPHLTTTLHLSGDVW